MSSTTFKAGTWIRLPSNCVRDYLLTFQRCSAYGIFLITYCAQWMDESFRSCTQWAWQAVRTCVSWVWQKSQQCQSWASQTNQQCCTWWPCSWACAIVTTIISWVCLLWAVVVTAVCAVFAIVVVLACLVFELIFIILCVVFTLLEFLVCLLWSILETIFCLSYANGGTAFLLTDGTVMVQESISFFGASWSTRRWWKLVPDEFGNYAKGHWVRLADSTFGRKYYASAVLADGKVLICGGEWTDASGSFKNDDNNSCDVYDPVTDTWSHIASPTVPGSTAVWPKIGDAPCTLLPDGTFLLGSIEGPNVTKLDPATMTWTAMNPRQHQLGGCSEESWVLMPDGTVVGPSCVLKRATWVYSISTDQWSRGNPLPMTVVDVGDEIGPGLLRYDGTAFFLGANQQTAKFDSTAHPQWSNGPDLPLATDGRFLGVVDGPAAILVNGNILFGAGPIDTGGGYNGPRYYFEFDGLMFNRTSDTPSRGFPTFATRLLLLPNGDVLFCRENSSSFYAYHSDTAQPQDAWRPVIQTCPTVLTPGSTIMISGLQFNGLSQAVAYGDDSQTATNYPLVRITNKQSSHVRYCRTFNHSTTDSSGKAIPSMGVATGHTVITTSVHIPSDVELGDSSLVVVANGIPSLPVDISVSPALD